MNDHDPADTTLALRFLARVSGTRFDAAATQDAAGGRGIAPIAAAASASLLAVLGLLILRNTLAAALTLTLVAGALILASGVMRIGMAYAIPEHRSGLLISGIASAVLGVIVLFNIVTATFTLLGVLLGVQVLLEGLTLAFFGRPQARRVPTESATGAPHTEPGRVAPGQA